MTKNINDKNCLLYKDIQTIKKNLLYSVEIPNKDIKTIEKKINIKFHKTKYKAPPKDRTDIIGFFLAKGRVKFLICFYIPNDGWISSDTDREKLFLDDPIFWVSLKDVLYESMKLEGIEKIIRSMYIFKD
jgi:hypothetical protein